MVPGAASPVTVAMGPSFPGGRRGSGNADGEITKLSKSKFLFSKDTDCCMDNIEMIVEFVPNASQSVFVH